MGVRFPELFSICVVPNVSDKVALIDLGLLTFRRAFGPTELSAWECPLECIALHTSSVDPDSMSWHLEASGHFSTKSLYEATAASPGPEELPQIWEIRLPLEIRIFLWQLVRGRVPSGFWSVSAMDLGMDSVPCAAWMKIPIISSYLVFQLSFFGVA